MTARLVLPADVQVWEPCPDCGGTVEAFACLTCGTEEQPGSGRVCAPYLVRPAEELQVPRGARHGVPCPACKLSGRRGKWLDTDILGESVWFTCDNCRGQGVLIPGAGWSGTADIWQRRSMAELEAASDLKVSAPLGVVCDVQVIARENVKSRGYRHGEHGELFTHWPVWDYRRLVDALPAADLLAFCTNLREGT